MTAKAEATSLGIDQEKSTASTPASASSLIPFPSSELRAIEQRLLAITDGRWAADGTCEDDELAIRVWPNDEDAEPGIAAIVFECPFEADSSKNGEANAEFIANAPTDISRLLDLVKTLREALEPFGTDYADRFVGPEEV